MWLKIEKCAKNSMEKPCNANRLGSYSHLKLQLINNALFF